MFFACSMSKSMWCGTFVFFRIVSWHWVFCVCLFLSYELFFMFKRLFMWNTWLLIINTYIQRILIFIYLSFNNSTPFTLGHIIYIYLPSTYTHKRPSANLRWSCVCGRSNEAGALLCLCGSNRPGVANGTPMMACGFWMILDVCWLEVSWDF